MSDAPKEIRICFIGESFVNGTGDPEFLGWTGRVCRHAEFAAIVQNWDGWLNWFTP
jgi:hypothetical protein